MSWQLAAVLPGAGFAHERREDPAGRIRLAFMLALWAGQVHAPALIGLRRRVDPLGAVEGVRARSDPRRGAADHPDDR
ncbi:MAG: hypothetical protein CML43_15295 [Rhodobacteraceae bacterium]|nr:hypothetical protein [Paracoccaceae bacterium]